MSNLTKSEPTTKKRTGRRLPYVLSDKQAEAILSVPNWKTAQGLRLRTMMEVMYRAGLRVSEVCSLTPADVDLDQQVIRVVAGKGNKDRLVPIHPRLLPMLQRWCATREADDNLRERVSLFGSFRGEPDRIHTWRSVKLCAEKAAQEWPHLGIEPEKVHPHTFRHVAATSLLRATDNLSLVQKLLGHASIATTQIYSHLTVDDLRAGMEKVATTG